MEYIAPKIYIRSPEVIGKSKGGNRRDCNKEIGSVKLQKIK